MFQTNPVNMGELLNDVKAGKIQLPDFQRGWVWDDDRIRGLLASISRRFPIGAVMTLLAGGDINFRTRPVEGVKSKDLAAPEFFLLDGQQRLTSLYQSLLHSGPVDTKDSRNKKIQRWYYIDMLKALDGNSDREDAIVSVPADRKITRNFGREIETDLSSRDLEYQQHLMPTECLLDSLGWTLGYIGYWSNSEILHPQGNATEFFEQFKNSVLDNFTGYSLPVISLDRDTPKEAVCTVFEKVNTGGVVLTVFELVTAAFAADAGSEHFSLREDWDSRKRRLSQYGVLQSIGGDQFLQAVALLTTQKRRREALEEGQPTDQAPGIRCNREAILSLSLEDYRAWAEKVESGLIESAKFLHSQYVFTSRDVPYNTQIVPMAALYVELGRELEPATARECLERWFWCGVLGEVYGGAVESQFALDLVEVSEYVRNGVVPRLITEAAFDPARLLYLQTRRSAAYKGIYALQMKGGAADWRTGEPLTVATWYNESIDIHHIFPVSWCEHQNPQVPGYLCNSVINKTPIDASTNRIIGGRAPSSYLNRLQQHDIGPEYLDKVLESHWINPGPLRSDNFAVSFVQRGEAIMNLIGEVMGKDLSDGGGVFQNALYRAGLWEPVELEGPVEEYEEIDEEFDLVGEIAFSVVEQEAAD